MQQATDERTSAADARWAGAPCAALTVGPDGTVLEINDAALLLVPALRTGAGLSRVAPWLSGAHPVPGTEPVTFSDVVDGRALEATPSRHDDGSVTWWLIDVTDVRSVRDELRIEQSRAVFLSDASAALLGSLNLQRCMEVIAGLAVDALADAAVVLTPATRRQFRVVTAVSGHGAPRSATSRLDPDEVPGLAEALQGFPPVPSRWIDPAAAPSWLVPPEIGEAGSIVVTPLPGHGIPAGALVLLRRPGSGPFSEGEESTAREFAARSGLAMSAARMFARQASITETLMRDLLPPKLQEIAGIEFAGGYRPAEDGDRVGGDFYDVHPCAPTPDGAAQTLAVLGDVCGKGLEAAVLTGRIRSTLHALLPMADDHVRLLGLLNDSLVSEDHTRFVTLVLASVTRDGSDVRLRLTAAGHPPPLIVRADGRVEEADTRGTLVGVLPVVEATTYETRLAPGETCLLYTDGITEALGGPMGRDQFGEQRLQRVAGECAGLPAEAVVERIQMVTTEWVGRNAHDDMALLAVSAPRGRHLSAVGGHGRGRYTA
nr:PP2C family protein-serine/threonine phosphatase [Pseudonocardia autotrophica]